MTITDDPAAIRDAVKSPDACTVQTVAHFKALLGYPTSKGSTDASGPPAAKSHTLTLKDAKTTSPYDARQRHNLATDIFNSSLKSLTEIARQYALVPKSSSDSKSTKALREISNPPALKNSAKTGDVAKASREPKACPSHGVAAVAECSVIACHYLSQSTIAKPKTKSSSPYQLQSGMLALAAKVLALGLDKHAIRLLSLVKKAISAPLNEKAPVKETLSSLLTIVDTPEDSTERHSLLASYLTLALRVIAAPIHAVSVANALPQLDPNASGSPCMVTLGSSTDTAKITRQLDTQAQSMSSMATNTSLAPLVRLKLHSHSLQTRQKCWRLDSSKVDLGTELIEPLFDAIRVYAQASKESPNQIYSAAAEVYNQVLGAHGDQQAEPAALASRAKLCRLMESLAQNEGDKAVWFNQSSSHGGISPNVAQCLNHLGTMSARIDLLLARNQALQRDMMIQCESSWNKACSEKSHELVEIIPAVNHLRKSTINVLQQAKCTKADKTLLVEAIFLCVRSTHRFAVVTKSSKKVLPPQAIARTVESALYAIGLWLTILDGDPEKAYEPSTQCTDMLSHCEDNNDKRLLHLSNVFWLAFQKLAQNGSGTTVDSSKFIVASLNLLNNASPALKVEGLYGLKLERLAELQIRDGHAAESYASMSLAIEHHISTSGVLELLAGKNQLSISASIRPEKDVAFFRRLLRLQLDVIERGQMVSGLYNDETLPIAQRTALVETQLVVGLAVMSELYQFRPGNHLRTLFNEVFGHLADVKDSLDPAQRLDICQVMLMLRLRSPKLLYDALIERVQDMATASEASSLVDCLKALNTGDISDPSIDSQITAWTQMVQNADAAGDCELFIFLLDTVSAHCTLLNDPLRGYKISSLLQRLLAYQTDCSRRLRILPRLSLDTSALGLSGFALESIEQGQQLLQQLGSKGDTFDRMDFHLAAFEVSTCIGDVEKAHAAFVAFHATSASITPRKSDRTRFYLCQARAGFLYSKFMLSSGHIAMGIHHGKESLRLYKSLIAAIEKQRYAIKQDSPVPSIDGLVDRVADLALADSGSTASRSKILFDDPELHRVQLQLFQAYCHMVDAHLTQGSKTAADHHLEKAKSLGSALSLPVCQITIAGLELRMVTLSGTSEAIDKCLKTTIDPTCAPSIASVRYYMARGDACLIRSDLDEALTMFQKSESLIKALSDTGDSFNGHMNPEASISAPAAQVALETKAGSRSRAKPNKPGNRVTKSKSSNTSVPDCSKRATHIALDTILVEIRSRQSLAHLKAGRIEDARLSVGSITNVSHSQTAAVGAQLLNIRVNLASVDEQLAADVKYNTIPEATIPLPSLANATLTASETMSKEPVKRTAKAKKPVAETCKVATLLRDTAQLTLKTMSSAVARLALNTGYQSCSLATTAVMLLSAMCRPVGTELHPVKAARTFQLPAIDGAQRQITDEAIDSSRTSLQELLRQAADGPRPSAAPLITTADYQYDYIDILPKSWTVVSIGLNEELDELRLARLGCEQTPFVLRLPLKRQAGNDMDGDTGFDFETGRNELRDIIECSNFSCHSPVDTSVKGAKTRWWTEREALDRRLHELLVNIENIWLGGFKGMFSLHRRRADLLARFRKSFDNILERYLPSRSGSGTTKTVKKPILDSNILELFIGLGNVSSEEPGEVEEQVLDLLHFVLDTLSFNGEANAYDEVDIDGMAIDTLEAMRRYSEADTSHDDQRHMILVLDKKLHNFPWESLSCLRGQSVSRVGSMLHVRERLLAMKRRKQLDRAVVSRHKGTYVVNPGGDLGKTQRLLDPALTPLLKNDDAMSESDNGWKSISGRAPVGDEFAQSLSNSNVFLYFGHGSGNQYISNRSVRKLQRAAQVVWLMGCSSGAVTDNGDLEPTSVPLSYLVAGESVQLSHVASGKVDQDDRVDSANELEGSPGPAAPQQDMGRDGVCMSVLATLWDVTDKDIDRFSIRVGQNWGLFADDDQALSSSDRCKASVPCTSTTAVPKTPGRKTSKANAPKTPAPRGAKTPSAARTATRTTRAAQTPKTNCGKRVDSSDMDQDSDLGAIKTSDSAVDKSLTVAVARSRDVCYLRYLNGAAPVVYGVPVYLGD